MYAIALHLHSLFRWVVLALAAAALGRAVQGAVARAPWRRLDDLVVRAFLVTLDVQLLVGVLLWVFWSPFGAAFREHPALALHDREARFWGMEHQVSMILAYLVARGGSALAKRRPNPHVAVLVTVLVWAALVATAFPWPGGPHARPLLRLPW